MSIVSRCSAALRSLGSQDMIINWLVLGKLTRREVLRYANHHDRVLRFRVWMELNRNPELLISLGRSGEAADKLFNRDVESLLTRPDARPTTIARVILGCLPRKVSAAHLAQARRVILSHRVPVQGDILSEIGGKDLALFRQIQDLLAR